MQCISVDKYALWVDDFTLPPEYVPPTGTLAGKVTEATKTDIEGVIVYIDDDSVATTDSNGDYSAEYDIGEFTATFVKDNYQQASFTVVIEESQTTTQNVQLIPFGTGTVVYETGYEDGDDPGFVNTNGTNPFERSSGFTYVYNPEKDQKGRIKDTRNTTVGPATGTYFEVCTPDPNGYDVDEYSLWRSKTTDTFFDMNEYAYAYVDLKVWSMCDTNEIIYFTIGNQSTYPSNYIQDYSLDGGVTWHDGGDEPFNGDTGTWVDVRLDVSFITGEVHGHDVRFGVFFIDDGVPGTAGPDGKGFGVAIDDIQITCYGNYLEAPKNFQVTSGIPDTVKLDWSPPTAAKSQISHNIPSFMISDDGVISETNIRNGNRAFLGYNIFRDGSFYDYTTDTLYFDTDVTDYTAYIYKVTAVYNEGESLPTEELQGVPGLIGHVAGTVTEAVSKGPIDGAVITATHSSYETVIAITASDGTYTIDLIPGFWNLTIEGWPYVYYYITETDTVTSVANETATRNYALARFLQEPQNLVSAGGASSVALNWGPPAPNGEIAYDSGPLHWILMCSYTAGPSDYVGVKFDCPLATPFYITDMAGGMMGDYYGGSNDVFETYGLYPDNSGVPDLANPIYELQNYQVITDDGPWYFFDTDVSVNTSSFWMVWLWPEASYYGPWVRSPDDVNTGHSYHSYDGVNWDNSWPGHNLASRVYVSQTAGKSADLVLVGGSDFVGNPTALKKDISNPTPEITTISNGSNAYITSGYLSRALNGYDIYRGNESGVYNPTPIYNTAGLTYNDSGLPEDDYYYAVKAIYAEGESDYSNETMATVEAALAVPWSTDFEADNGGFVGDGDWEWGVPTFASGPSAAYSGTKVWGTVLDGNYSPSQNAWLTSKPFDLTTGDFVSFAVWYELEAGYDYGYFAIDHDGDANYDILATYNGSSTAKGVWLVNGFDIPDSYSTDYARFAFILSSDGGTEEAGFYIDDFSISLAPPQNVNIEVSGNDVVLTWAAISGATDYKVYYSTDPYTGFTELTGATGGPTYTHIGGASGTKYFYEITGTK